MFETKDLAIAKFQFQYGEIKRDESFNNLVSTRLFQFQYGEIKSSK